MPRGLARMPTAVHSGGLGGYPAPLPGSSAYTRSGFAATHSWRAYSQSPAGGTFGLIISGTAVGSLPEQDRHGHLRVLRPSGSDARQWHSPEPSKHNQFRNWMLGWWGLNHSSLLHAARAFSAPRCLGVLQGLRGLPFNASDMTGF